MRTLLLKNGLLGLALATAFASCKKDDAANTDVTSKVVLINLSPMVNAPQDVMVNGAVATPGLAYKATSNESGSVYLSKTKKKDDPWTLSFNNSGSTTANASATPTWENGKKYSATLYDTGSSRKILILEDDGLAVATGKAKVRFMHGVLGLNPLGGTSYPVDILLNRAVAIDSVAYGTASDYITIDAGTDSLNAQIHGFPGPLVPVSIPFNFASGKTYTIYGCGIAGLPLTDQRGFGIIYTINN